MNELKPMLLVFCLVACISGCLSQQKEDNVLYFNYFPDSASIKLEPWFKQENARFNRLHTISKKLFATDLSSQRSRLIYCFDTETVNLLETYFHRTHKQFGGITPLSSGILQDSIIWFYDLTLSRMVSININAKDSSQLPKQCKLNSQYRSIAMMNDSLALVTGNLRSTGNELLSVINVFNGEIQYDLELYPGKAEDVTERQRRLDQQAIIYYNDKKSMAVMAKNLQDEFYIIHPANRKLIKVRGPEHPGNKSKRDQDADMNHVERRYYTMSFISEKFIYLLLITKPQAGENIDQGNAVLVFDWAGKPVKRFELSTLVKSIAVLEDTNEIIGFNSVDGMFYKGSLDGSFN